MQWEGIGYTVLDKKNSQVMYTPGTFHMEPAVINLKDPLTQEKCRGILKRVAVGYQVFANTKKS